MPRSSLGTGWALSSWVLEPEQAGDRRELRRPCSPGEAGRGSAALCSPGHRTGRAHRGLCVLGPRDKAGRWGSQEAGARNPETRRCEAPVSYTAGEVQTGVPQVGLEAGVQEAVAALGADVGGPVLVHALVRAEAAAIGQHHGAGRAHLSGWKEASRGGAARPPLLFLTKPLLPSWIPRPWHLPAPPPPPRERW